jgi:hypothetical protein
MKIEVLSIEGMSAATTAWRLSRDQSAEVDWREVFTVDVPVNEMPTAHLHFVDMTILEREIFASSRSHVMWARTSHVDDPLLFQAPDELIVAAPTGFLRDCRRIMTERKAAGASQDEWRENLPVISTTSWTARMSFRDLVKMTGYFNRLAGDQRLVLPLRRRLSDVTTALGWTIAAFTDGEISTAWEAVRRMQRVDFLHEGDVSFSPRTSTENFHCFTLSVPLWLRAQIVRHRPLSFVDNFFMAVLARPEVLGLTIAAPVGMELSASRSYWRSIMSKRSCWIAQDSLTRQHDPWQAILDQFGFDEGMLPCADGRCPYAKDASLRLTDADPGAPCPIYMDINHLDKAPRRDEMLLAARSRHPLWVERINS